MPEAGSKSGDFVVKWKLAGGGYVNSLWTQWLPVERLRYYSMAVQATAAHLFYEYDGVREIFFCHIFFLLGEESRSTV